MRIPGPYSDDTWDWLPRNGQIAEAAKPDGANSVLRVIWELGLVLAVPLAGAGLVGLCLQMCGVY